LKILLNAGGPSPLLSYIGEGGRTLGRTYGIKARCYWEHPWETHWEPKAHVGNLMRTHWKLEGNMLGTKEKRKKSPTPLPPKLQRKINKGTLSAC